MYEIGPLIQTDSISLLNSIYPAIRHSHAKYISDITEGIPLLLEIIGHQIKEGLYSAPEFVILTNKTEYIDPGNFHSFFYLLEILVLKLDPHLQKVFVTFKYKSHHESSILNDHFKMAKFGLFKFSSKNVQFEMHNVLIEFSFYFSQTHPELIQWQELITMEDFLTMLLLVSLTIVIGCISVTISKFVESCFKNEGELFVALFRYPFSIITFSYFLHVSLALFTDENVISSIENTILIYKSPFLLSILTIFLCSNASKKAFIKEAFTLIYVYVVHIAICVASGKNILSSPGCPMTYKVFPIPCFYILLVSYTSFILVNYLVQSVKTFRAALITIVFVSFLLCTYILTYRKPMKLDFLLVSCHSPNL